MTRACRILLVASLFASGGAHAAQCSLSPEAQSGRDVSHLCTSCHSIDSDDPSTSVAPNIHDVFGARPAGRHDFHDYSDGMKGASAKGVVWTEDTLSAYLFDPKAFLVKVNGGDVQHAMFFQLRNDVQRKDVIAFLKEIKGHPECR